MAALRRQPETQELVGAPLYSSQDPIIFITRIPRHKLEHLLSNNGLALERVLSMVDFDTQRKYWEQNTNHNTNGASREGFVPTPLNFQPVIHGPVFDELYALNEVSG